MAFSCSALKGSAALICLTVAGSLGAQAQDIGIETVIVTAQKVEQDAQRTPLSLSTFSSQDLEKSHIETIGDIAQRTPGFTATAFTPAELNLSIRGIGSSQGISQNAAGDPSVVVFMDGVYAGRGGLADIDAYNLERVEVLRGPQGTLYGKNAAGGLVNFISKKADDKYAVKASATIGNYNAINVNGVVNVPLSDNLFFSAGASSKNRNGFEYNETTGNRVNDLHMSTVQGQLRYLPSESLELILSADYTNQDQKGNPRHNICDSSFQMGVHCVGVNPDPRVVNAWTDGNLRRDLANVRGEINWTTPIGTVTSITAYRDVRTDSLVPFFSNPVNQPNQIESTEHDKEKNKQFSQELRLGFNTMDDQLNGVVGVYFLNEKNNRNETLLQQFPTATGLEEFPQHVTGRSFALFGQANYKILENLTATVGARMTWEKKDGHFAGILLSHSGTFPPPAPLSVITRPTAANPLDQYGFDVKASKSWNAFTPKAALEWQVTEDAMVYGSASRGFKSGGFQGIASTGGSASVPYDPEYAWNYELGAKTRWFDNRLQLNGTLFKTDFTNLQISQLIALYGVVVGNAAEAEIKGAELEFVALPFSFLQIDGSWAYLDAKYTKFDPTASINYPGNTLTRAPKNKINLGVQLTQEVPIGVLTARVDYMHTSKYFFDPNNIATQTQPGYSMVDGRISLSSLDDHWEVSVWGKNLGDKLVANYVTAFAPYRQVLVPYAPPRTFGITLTFKS